MQLCNWATSFRTILLLHFSTSARFRPYRVCQCCRCVRFWSTPPSPALPLTVHSPLGSSNNATALLARNERLVALCETATMVRTLLHTSTIRALQTTISLFCGRFLLFFSPQKEDSINCWGLSSPRASLLHPENKDRKVLRESGRRVYCTRISPRPPPSC